MILKKCYVCYLKNNNEFIEVGDIHCVFTTAKEAEEWCRFKNENIPSGNYFYDYEVTII